MFIVSFRYLSVMFHEISSRSFLSRVFVLAVFVLLVLYVISPFQLKQTPFRSISTRQVPIISPFSRTMAFIRWNSGYRERISVIENYRPFFAQLHYSIPGYTTHCNYTADGLTTVGDPYRMVSETMEIILKDYPIIEGILYFHFDAWINPLKFAQMNFEKIWFPDAHPPPFKCLRNESDISWWTTTAGLHQTAKNARRNIEKKYPRRFNITEQIQFCVGWSDFYYIPRRFFRDFIDLSVIHHSVASFHEIAIPTIVKIIDFNSRLTSSHSVITPIVDCWGNCCANGARPIDIKEKRCGHRMDLGNDLIRISLIELLNAEAIYLNKTPSISSL